MSHVSIFSPLWFLQVTSAPILAAITPPPPPRPQEGFIGGKEASCTLSGGLLNLTSEFVLPLGPIVQTAYLRARRHARRFVSDRFSAS